MPRYKYYCDICLETYETWHGIDEVLQECEKCTAKDSLTRVPSFIMDNKKIVETKKVGDVTNEFIEKNRDELNRLKNKNDWEIK